MVLQERYNQAHFDWAQEDEHNRVRFADMSKTFVIHCDVCNNASLRITFNRVLSLAKL